MRRCETVTALRIELADHQHVAAFEPIEKTPPAACRGLKVGGLKFAGR